MLRTVLLAALLASSTAYAQPDSSALLQEAAALRAEGRDAEAVTRLEEAFRLEPSGRVLAQLGLCELALGRLIAAEDHISQALAASSSWIEENRAVLEEQLGRARAGLGTVVVLLRGPPAARLELSATSGPSREEQITGTTRIRVDAGQYTLRARAEGYRDTALELHVRGGAEHMATLELEPEERRVQLPVDTPSAATSAPVPPPTPRSPVGAVLTAAGGTLFVTGIALGIGAWGRYRDEQDAPHAGSNEHIAKLSVPADVLGAIGIGLLIAGVVVLVRRERAGSPTPDVALRF